MEKIEVVCPRDCYDTCSLIFTIDDSGKLKNVRGDPRHPITQGFICPRGVGDLKRVYKNRILYPYVRTGRKPGRDFKRVGWSEALDLIAEKLKQVLKNYGPKTILHLEYAGNMGLLTWYFPQRFWNAIGASKTDYSVCSKSGHEALSLHYGLSYGVQPDELLEMKLIVYWGFNAVVSAPHLWALSVKARRRGGRISVVDSRRSETAKRADIWLCPKPGSDVALAFGVARYLIEHGYVDLDFIREWTYGYEEYKREVLKWTPERVEEVTDVKWSKIEALGEAYGRLKPSATMMGFGFQKSIYGAESVRAVSLIPALLGLHRGFYYSNSRGYGMDISYLTGEKLYGRKVRVVSQVALAEYLKRGEFKFVYIYNMNPAVTLPGQKALRKGLSREDVFVVVHDTHWTETAEYADVVLPAATYLEKTDVVIPYSHRYVKISKKVIEPLGESKSEIWVMKELASRLGMSEVLREDHWKALEKAFKDSLEDGSFSDLINGKMLKLRYMPLNRYQTPTGKIEFYSLKAEKLGLNPLPQQYPLLKKRFILLNSSTFKY
ncbi:MAG: formate dehydrogenase, partial [Thermoprotei archaeon]